MQIITVFGLTNYKQIMIVRELKNLRCVNFIRFTEPLLENSTKMFLNSRILHSHGNRGLFLRFSKFGDKQFSTSRIMAFPKDSRDHRNIWNKHLTWTTVFVEYRVIKTTALSWACKK